MDPPRASAQGGLATIVATPLGTALASADSFQHKQDLVRTQTARKYITEGKAHRDHLCSPLVLQVKIHLSQGLRIIGVRYVGLYWTGHVCERVHRILSKGPALLRAPHPLHTLQTFFRKYILAHCYKVYQR